MRGPTVSKLNAADGTSLHVVDWPSSDAGTERRGVLILHGIGEHSGRYGHVARFFNDLGFDVRCHDHRGHGRSGGTRGDVPDDLAMVRDATLVMNDFAKRFDTPPLLLGHSMGGLFAARMATQGAAPISGLILSSPALAIPLSGVQKLLLNVMSAVAPGLGISNNLPTRYLSHDPAVVEAYCKDPLVHPKITARLLHAMLAAVGFSQQHARQLKIPTLLLVAGADRLVDARGSDAFFSRLQPSVGTMHRYPDLYHEIFNETAAAQVFADLRTWLEAQCFTLKQQARSA